MKQSAVLAGCYIVLALATIAAYEGVRRNDFVHYDDTEYVSNNPHITGGLTRESVFWAFTTSHMANWHPLTWLSHMLDCELFDVNPFWHHLSSLLFHIANTLLLFWVLKKMTGKAWCSAFVAAAFALHPLHVESVAWISERKDVLSTLFLLLTIAAYLRYVRRPSISRYLLTLLTFALGLTAKPMLVTLPFVLLLLDYWPLDRFRNGQDVKDANQRSHKSVNTRSQWLIACNLVWEKVPFFALSMASSVVTFIVQQSWGAVWHIEKLPLNLRVANALVSYISYIGKMVYPSSLAVLYPFPVKGLPLWQPIVSLVVLAAITAGVVYTGRRRRYLVLGWFWYLGTLVPVIGFVQVGSQAMADRYTYLPSIGFFIMVAWGAAELFAKWRYRRITLGIWAGMVLIVLATCTRAQVRHWKDHFSLFSHAVAVTKDNFLMHYNYGNVMLERGQLDQAIKHYAEALRIEPNFAYAYNNLGLAFVRQGKLNEGIQHYIEALRLEPNHPVYTSNLAIALKKQGNIGETIKVWKKILESNTDNAEAYCNLAVALSADGKFGQAIIYFKKALSRNPDMVNANYNLGNTYQKLGQFSEAARYYDKALNLVPDLAEAHYNLGIVLLKQGKTEKAVYHWNKTLQLKPDSPDVLNNLAWILAATEDTKIQKPATAVEFAQRACELTNYSRPRMLDTLAVAYAAAGRFSEAVATAEKALSLALSSKQQKLAEDIRKRLKLFKAEQPYRESL